MTNALIESTETKYKLYKKVQRNLGNINLLNEYKQYRNTPNNLVKLTKNTYYKTQIKNSQNNPKLLWNCIKVELKILL